jgi:hypothetical protein
VKVFQLSAGLSRYREKIYSHCFWSRAHANGRPLQYLCYHTGGQYRGQHEFGYYNASGVILYANLDLDGYGYCHSHGYSNSDCNIDPADLRSHAIAGDFYCVCSDAQSSNFDGLRSDTIADNIDCVRGDTLPGDFNSLCGDAISGDHDSSFVSIQIVPINRQWPCVRGK